MPTLTNSKAFDGESHYAIVYRDGPEPIRKLQGAVAELTDDQAKLGVDACAALFETNRLGGK